ncbi:MAG TPA: DUF4129 domain-containing protein [Streptosporangiaceae bacterium]|jgi:hypothetical protein
MPGKDARSGVDLRRPAAVLLLIAIAAIGLQAGVSLSNKSDPRLLVAGGHALYWIAFAAGGLLVLLELAIVVVWLVWARKGGTRLPLQRKRRNPLYLIVIALEIWALVKIISILRQRAAEAARHAAAAHPGHSGGSGGHFFLPPASSWPLLAGLALAAVAATLLIMPARRRAKAFATTPPEPEPQSQAPLLAALAAGERPLREDADPRAAIVHCYAAMEESLAAAGTPPARADTPAEVLDRASRGGLLRSAAASTLTGLFRQARYSTHPITEADRAAAQHALGRLQADLEGTA